MSADGLLARLERLFEIGGGPGANRPGLSAQEDEAFDMARGWMDDAGLETKSDPAGNLYGRLRGRDGSLPEIWTGSHLDTVPRGGRFDGALGVVGGVDALERLGRSGRLQRSVAVVAFRDEEGTRFSGGCFGSRALCGRLESDELEKVDRSGVSVRQALAALGIGAPPLGGFLRSQVGAFLELHIEQGPRLGAAGAPLGVVTGIAGTSGTKVTFTGTAGHAGTTPMSARADAFAAAAVFALEVRRAALAVPDAVATLGQVGIEPGAANVIPGQATLTVDARAPDQERLSTLLGAIDRAALAAGERESCAVGTERLWVYEPVFMSAEPLDAIRAAVHALGCEALELASGAGHDASVLAAAGIPTGMLFVRSGAGGVSHTPEEWTEPEDVELAVSALAGALRALAGT
jgi:allantoate deiminase